MVKRLAVVLLALALVMSYAGMAAGAAKFTDTADSKHQAAIERIASLGVVTGYPDGTFKPEGTITRAEFAAVMCRVLGLEDAAKIMAGSPTSFSDVAVDHWATGYINVASSQGIINGYPDGTFKPEAPVTYAESMAMIIRALGYEPSLKGVWPVKYVAKGAELGISDGVTVAANVPAVRGDVARMVDNSLDIPKMVQVGYGDEVKYVVSGTDGTEEKTLLDDNLGMTKVEGRVTDISFTDSKLDADELKIGGDAYKVVASVDVPSLLGLEVTLWVNDDDEAVYVKTETDAEDILYDSVAKATDKEVELKVADDTFDWADDAEASLNFASTDLDEVPVGAYGKFVLNDDGDVAFACVFDFDLVSAGVVTEATEKQVTYLDGTAEDDIKYEDYDDGVNVFDAKFHSLKVGDIKADSLIYAWDDGDELFMVVAGEKKEGELDAIRTSNLTLDGTKYDLADGATFSANEDEDVAKIVGDDKKVVSDVEDLLAETVAVLLDINGEVRHVRADVATTTALQFGVALKGSDAGVDTPAKVKIMTKDGATKTYALEDDDDYAPYGDAPYDDSANVLVAFKLNSKGEIAEGKLYWDVDGITDLTDDYGTEVTGSPTDVDADDDYVVLGGDKYYVTDDTVIFNINKSDPGDAGWNIADDDNVDAVAWADIEDMDTDGVELVVIPEAKGSDIAVMYFTAGYDTVVSEDVFYGVVTEEAWLTSDGWKAKVDVCGEGEKEYLLADNAEDDFVEGAVVAFTLSAEDEAKKITSVTVYEDTVAARSGRYLDFGDGWVRIANDAVLYRLEDDGAIDVAIDYDDIEAKDEVAYVLDDAGRIAALTVGYVAEEEPGELSVSITGPAVFDSKSDALVVKIQSAESDEEYMLRVYEGTTVEYVDGSVDTDADGESYTGDQMGLAAGKEYVAKVSRVSDGEILATKTFYTDSQYQP